MEIKEETSCKTCVYVALKTIQEPCKSCINSIEIRPLYKPINNNPPTGGTSAQPQLAFINADYDPVEKPMHYNKGKYEVIDIIESVVESMDLTPTEAVLTSQVLKYVSRWKNKNLVQDLKKAQWYLTRLIKNMEEK